MLISICSKLCIFSLSAVLQHAFVPAQVLKKVKCYLWSQLFTFCNWLSFILKLLGLYLIESAYLVEQLFSQLEITNRVSYQHKIDYMHLETSSPRSEA